MSRMTHIQIEKARKHWSAWVEVVSYLDIIEALEAEGTAMREALRFYADTDNWKQHHTEHIMADPDGGENWHIAAMVWPAVEDAGKCARTALVEPEENNGNIDS